MAPERCPGGDIEAGLALAFAPKTGRRCRCGSWRLRRRNLVSLKKINFQKDVRKSLKLLITGKAPQIYAGKFGGRPHTFAAQQGERHLANSANAFGRRLISNIVINICYLVERCRTFCCKTAKYLSVTFRAEVPCEGGRTI